MLAVTRAINNDFTIRRGIVGLLSVLAFACRQRIFGLHRASSLQVRITPAGCSGLRTYAFRSIPVRQRKEAHCEPSSDDCRENRADDKQDPAPPLPNITEPRDLNEDIAEVCSAVADVREYRQHEKDQYSIEGRSGSAVRPVDGEVGQDDQRQHDVVGDSPGFPVPDSVRYGLTDTYP